MKSRAGKLRYVAGECRRNRALRTTREATVVRLARSVTLARWRRARLGSFPGGGATFAVLVDVTAVAFPLWVPLAGVEEALAVLGLLLRRQWRTLDLADGDSILAARVSLSDRWA